jgi:L-alanine-DL-glutamate epimerase-like enolase superfamily enzyme
LQVMKVTHEAFSRRFLRGQNRFDIEALWFKLYHIEHNAGPVMYSAMAGIEVSSARAWDQGVWSHFDAVRRSRLLHG